jgi:mannose-6-phosphate isomerase
MLAAVTAEPIAFSPLFMERVWGGRMLEEHYGKPLPPGPPIGESWEVVDREEAQSVVAGGAFDGRTLHELWTGERARLFGARAATCGERFPILIKLLDARDTLSVQVHPPTQLAAELGGEPKNELWYVTATAPGAHVFAGLRAGVTRAAFSAALTAGQDISAMLHRADVEPGDAIFIPSGRVHAIGAGCLIMEIQQNSDTTYRVFDFNRPGLDGEPRELHIPESMASIDWDDVEPPLLRGDGPLTENAFFRVQRRVLSGATVVTAPGECTVVAVVEGALECGGVTFPPGSFFLVPADGGADLPVVPADGQATVLVTELPG